MIAHKKLVKTSLSPRRSAQMKVMKAHEKKVAQRASGCSASFYNDFCTRSGSRRDGCTSICQGSDINSHIFKRRQLSNGWAVQKHPHLLLKVTHEQTVDQCWLFKNRIKSSGKKDRRLAGIINYYYFHSISVWTVEFYLSHNWMLHQISFTGAATFKQQAS